MPRTQLGLGLGDAGGVAVGLPGGQGRLVVRRLLEQAGLLQPVDRRPEVVGLHRADGVVGLVVVGPQQELGEVPGHAGALLARPVQLPAGRPHDGLARLGQVLVPLLHGREPLL
jgi:hypothetical protein